MEKILVVSKPNCTECERIKSLLKDRDIPFEEVNMESLDKSKQFDMRNVARKNRQASMPMLFVSGEFKTTEAFEQELLG